MATTEAKTTCSRHPRVETNLRCASCGTPICPKCLVQTLVGMKCRECGMQRGGTLFSIKPHRALAAGASAIALGAVAGLGVDLLGWLILLVAVAYGTFAGEMIVRASGRKRGKKLELIAGLGMVMGALGGRIVVAALPPSLGVGHVLLDLVLPTPIPIASLVIAIASAVGRIRYI